MAAVHRYKKRQWVYGIAQCVFSRNHKTTLRTLVLNSVGQPPEGSGEVTRQYILGAARSDTEDHECHDSTTGMTGAQVRDFV